MTAQRCARPSTAVSGFTASKDTPKTTAKTRDERIMKSGLMNYFTLSSSQYFTGAIILQSKLTLENGVVCREE